MKTYKILLLITLIFGVAYFMLDRQLYFYGKNDFNFYNLLPLNIVPEDRPDFENGFAIKDEYGFTIAAKGNTYKFKDTSIIINEVLSYYFNNEKVIARIIDSNDKKYYIEFTSNREKKKNQDIIANVWTDDKIINSSEFKCINIKDNEKKIKKIVSPRNYLMIAFIIMFIISFYKTIKSIEKKH